MRTSVSEIKTFRECQRKWYFSGRNGMYLRPIKDIPAFKTGSAFHDALEAMYKQEKYDLEEIISKHDVEESEHDMLKFQVKKYEENVIKNDLKTMDIIAPELSYNIQLENGVVLFGFIDVVYKEKKTGKVGILEHKFVRNFRSDTYNQLDEQIKAYELALKEIYGQCDAGVNLNQVRKLKTKFDHARETYKQTDEQMLHFYSELLDTTSKMLYLKEEEEVNHAAEPHWMGCSFCDYKDLCLKMNAVGTNDTRIITEEDIKEAGLR